MMKHHFFLFVKLWIILFVVISAASIWMHRHTFGFRLSKGLLEIFSTIPELSTLWTGCVVILIAAFIIRLLWH